MRRTVLSALIVASGMVAVGTGVVAAFDAVSDPQRPVRVQRSTETVTDGIGAAKDAAPNAGDPASVPPTPVPGGSPSEVTLPEAPPSEDADTVDDVVEPAIGVLSDAFAELALDDPTTPDVDESAPDPCTALVSPVRDAVCVVR